MKQKTGRSGNKERVFALDVLRILSCISVIGIHILMDYCVNADGSANSPVLLAESLIRWAVPCFLMLSGYFLFQKDLSLGQLLKKAGKRIALPSALTVLFITVFGAWILGSAGFLQCLLAVRPQTLGEAVRKMLLWELPEPGFWLGYMVTILKMYLLYPVLKFLCREEKGARESRWFLMALTFAGQFLVPALHLPLYVYVPVDSYALLYVLLGYEGFRLQKQGLFQKRWLPAVLTGVFLGSGAATWAMSLWLDIGRNGTFTESYFGYTSWNIALEAAAVFGLFLTLAEKKKAVPPRPGAVVSWISGRTMVVYLVHYLVILKLRTKGYEERLNQLLGGGHGGLFLIGMIAAVFGISLGIAGVLWWAAGRGKRRQSQL